MVYIRSSNKSRTLLSAEFNAVGMFPSSQWPPVPIHTVRYEDDFYMNNNIKCPRYKQIYTNFIESSEFKYQFKKNADFINYLNLNTGMMLLNSDEVMFLIDKLQIEKDKGLMYVISNVMLFFVNFIIFLYHMNTDFLNGPIT